MLRTIDQFFNNRELTSTERMYLEGTMSKSYVKTDPSDMAGYDIFIEPELLEDDDEPSYCSRGDSDCVSGRVNPKKEIGKKYLKNKKYDKKYVVSLIGRNEKGERVCCHVLDYAQALYVQIPTRYEAKTYEYMEKDEKSGNPKDYKLDEDRELSIKGAKYFSDRAIEHLKNNTRVSYKHKGKIESYEIISRKIFRGFRNGRKNLFLKIYFKNDSAKRAYYYACTNPKFYIPNVLNGPMKVFEFKVPTFARFFHDGNHGTILPQSWIQAKKFVNIPSHEKLTNCECEISAKYEDILTLNDKKEMVTSVKMAWDIETAPKKRRKGHPDLDKGDPIIQIGCSFLISKGSMLVGLSNKVEKTSDFDGLYNIIFTLNKSKPSKDSSFKIIECKNEFDLLEKFIEVMRKGPAIYFPKLKVGKNVKMWAPDYSITYNGNNFDWKYVYQRCKELFLHEEIDRTSTFFNYLCHFEKKEVTSAAMGKVTNWYLIQPGIVNIDLLKFIEKMQITDMMDVKLKTSGDYFLLGSKTGHESIIKHYMDCIDEYGGDGKSIYEGDGTFTKKFFTYLKQSFEAFHAKKSEENEKGKIDLAYEEMYEYYFDSCENPDDEESKEKMKTVADYCIRDCVILHRLLDKIAVIYNFESRSNVTMFPMKNIIERGVGIVNFCFIAWFTQIHGFLHPHIQYDQAAFEKPFKDELRNNQKYREFYEKLDTEEKKEKEKKKFLDRFRIAGAIVFNPKTGQYENVATLDVNSMYPSAIRTHNLSHEMVVLQDKRYGNIPGVKYKTITWEGKDYRNYNETKKDPPRRMKYETKVVVSTPGEDDDEGIIGKALKYLLRNRNAVKAKMKKEKPGSVEYLIYDLEQQAIKILMNGIYGLLSDMKSAIFMKCLGGMTTQKSRDYLILCKDLVEKNFEGSKIIYGDTDSIFIQYKIPKYITSDADKFYYAWDQSIKAEKFINKTAHEMGLTYMTIELEKVFSKLFLYGVKKRYFGILHTKRDFNAGKLKIMGVKSKKRDSTRLEKFAGEIIRYYVIQYDMMKVIPFVKSLIKYSYEGLFDETYFLKSGRYKPPYKFPDRVPHAVAVKIIKKKDKAIQIDTNERVYYLYKRIPYRKGKRGGKIIPKKTLESTWPYMLYDPSITIDYKMYFDFVAKNSQDILGHVLNVDSELTQEQKERYIKRNFIDPEIYKYEDVYADNDIYLKDDLESLKGQEVDRILEDDKDDSYLTSDVFDEFGDIISEDTDLDYA